MNENILLVEDEHALRMIVGDRLRKQGYLVDCASDGETALQKATSQPFDLMILDVMLPHRSGLDLCRDIRRAGLGMPVLMLTARRTAEDMLAGFNAGANAYVTKPFDMQELSARVETLLRRAPGVGSTAQGPSHLPTVLMQQSEVAKPGTVGSQSRSRPQDAVRAQKLRADLVVHFSTPGSASQLAEVTPRLRKTLDDERRGPQTPRNAVIVGAAKGIIEFLEEMLQALRARRK